MKQTSLPGFGQNPASLDINFIQLKPYYNVVNKLCEHRLQGNGIALASAFADAYQNAHKDQVCMMHDVHRGNSGRNFWTECVLTILIVSDCYNI